MMMAQGVSAMMRRVASLPSMTGIASSIRMISGRAAGASLHGFRAIGGDPRDLQVGLAGQRLPKHVHRRRFVVDDAYFHAPARPMRSSTASSSASSWKLLFPR